MEVTVYIPVKGKFGKVEYTISHFLVPNLALTGKGGWLQEPRRLNVLSKLQLFTVFHHTEATVYADPAEIYCGWAHWFSLSRQIWSQWAKRVGTEAPKIQQVVKVVFLAFLPPPDEPLSSLSSPPCLFSCLLPFLPLSPHLPFSFLSLVSDIAIFVLKRDVKLQLTNFPLPQNSKSGIYGHPASSAAIRLLLMFSSLL